MQRLKAVEARRLEHGQAPRVDPSERRGHDDGGGERTRRQGRIEGAQTEGGSSESKEADHIGSRQRVRPGAGQTRESQPESRAHEDRKKERLERSRERR